MDQPLPETGPALASASINKIAEALSKAQSQIQGAKKDAINPHFKSNYADLASIWDVIRGPLSANGLAIAQQTTREPASGSWIVATTLMHSSGQWISSAFPILAAQQTSQAMGAAVTYARRYALSALVGVAQVEDDDGNADSKPAPRQAARHPAMPPTKPASPFTRPASQPRKAPPVDINEPPFDPTDPGPGEPPPNLESDFDTPLAPPGETIQDLVDKAKADPQVALAQDKRELIPPKLTLIQLAKKKGITPAMLNAVSKKFTQKSTIDKLSKAEYDFVYAYVEKTGLETFKRDFA